eukprot:1512196-Rhodomonas_salina.1
MPEQDMHPSHDARVCRGHQIQVARAARVREQGSLSQGEKGRTRPGRPSKPCGPGGPWGPARVPTPHQTAEGNGAAARQRQEIAAATSEHRERIPCLLSLATQDIKHVGPHSFTRAWEQTSVALCSLRPRRTGASDDGLTSALRQKTVGWNVCSGNESEGSSHAVFDLDVLLEVLQIVNGACVDETSHHHPFKRNHTHQYCESMYSDESQRLRTFISRFLCSVCAAFSKDRP